MTNVIAFKVPSRTAAPRAQVDGPAEILFFTGVRYVRDEPPPAIPDASPRPAGAAHPSAAAEERLHA